MKNLQRNIKLFASNTIPLAFEERHSKIVVKAGLYGAYEIKHAARWAACFK